MNLGMLGVRSGWRKATPEYKDSIDKQDLQKKRIELLKGVQPEEYFVVPKTPDEVDLDLAREQMKAMLLAKQITLTREHIRECFKTLQPLLLDLPRVTKNKQYVFPRTLAKQLDIKPTQERAKKLKRILKVLQEEEEEVFLFLL